MSRFDYQQIQRETCDAVAGALARHGVAHVLVPGPHNTVGSVAVALDDRPAAWRALRAELTGAEWAGVPYGRPPVDETERGRPLGSRRLAAAGAVRIYRALQAPSGELLAQADLGCDLDFWARTVGDRTPRADGGVHSAGTYVAPRPNGRAAYLSPSAWAKAVAAPNRWISDSNARPILELDAPVDIVYTWVDGDDPRWQARRAEFTDAPVLSELHETSNHDSRFRSRDELRYSLRSVEMFAPWARRIFVVTDDQVPEWLNTANEKITVIDHKEIFSDPSVLPVFNSHAIESQLHHIPGLAEHYLYLNDDFFLGRPVTPESFFHGNGISKFFLSNVTLDVEDTSKLDLPVLSAAKRNRELLQEHFGVLITQKFRHTPQPQLRSVLEEMERRHPDLFAEVAASRFRHRDDYSIPSALVHYYAFLLGRAVPGKIQYGYQDISKGNTQLWLDGVLRRRNFDVFCLNDNDIHPGTIDGQRAMLQEFLERYYPLPCSFEKQ